MSTAKVPEIEYAAFDAMKEVASSLKAAYFRQQLATDSELEIKYWTAQEDFVQRIVSGVDNTDLEEICAAAEFFARLLDELETRAKVA